MKGNGWFVPSSRSLVPFLFCSFALALFVLHLRSITKEQSKRNKRNEKKVNKKKGTTTNQELGE